MEDVEFIRMLQKMCTGRHCDDCPLSENYRCNVCYTDDPEESVRIVEEWAAEQERKKTEQERKKTEKERQNPEHPEESSDLHAIINEIEDRIYKLADRIAALEEYPVESMNEQKRTNKDALLAAFPNSRMDYNGIPYACPNRLDAHYNCDKFENCLRCRHTRWLAESEEN